VETKLIAKQVADEASRNRKRSREEEPELTEEEEHDYYIGMITLISVIMLVFGASLVW